MSAMTKGPSVDDPAYCEGPFFYVAIPVNADGCGPEMDPKKVTRTQHEVWNLHNLSIGSFENATVAHLVATALNRTMGHTVAGCMARSGVLS